MNNEKAQRIIDGYIIGASEVKMKTLNDMTLNERIKLYAEGDKQHKIPAHSFDFTRQDAEDIMSALRIVWLLSREDYPHNWRSLDGHQNATYTLELTSRFNYLLNLNPCFVALFISLTKADFVSLRALLISENIWSTSSWE